MDNNTNINIVIRDFKKDLINLINNSQLPGFLVYEILNGITLQIANQIQQEIKDDTPTEN